MVVADCRLALPLPAGPRNTAEIRGRLRKSRPFFSRMKLSFRAWLVIRKEVRMRALGARRLADLGCGKAAKKGRGKLFLARQFAAAVTALFLSRQ